jgi:thiamine kinase-like enzyme
MPIEKVDYPFGTPTTEDAFRVRTADGVLFVKVVRSFRRWPLIHTLPPELAQQAIDSPLWHYEADVYTSGVGDVLPDGMRLPVVHAVADLGDDRMAIVMENVEVTATPWDTARFARAARRLARLNVRLTRTDTLPASASRVPGFMTGLHYDARLRIADLPALADDRTWSHPLLAPHVELRARLDDLAAGLPAMIERLRALPQLMVHGDFSPQNLLVPADEPETFVVIDWSLGGLAAVGDDLGQLLIGFAHAGLLPVDELPALHDVLLDAYLEGLADEGYAATREQVRTGFDGGLLLRSTFTALPLTRLHEPPSGELAALVEERVALTSHLCEVSATLISC